MSQVSLLIKPASSLCNLRCKYCFYSDVSHNRQEESMGIMTNEVMRALIDKSLELPVDTIQYLFQGGEPTCAGISYFKEFIAYVNEKNIKNKEIRYGIQTNGTQINDAWIKLFQENHFLVGISLDGFALNHNYFRKDIKGEGTFKDITFNIRRLNNAGIETNILTVLTKELSRKPKELYEFYKKNNMNYVQIIPCLPSLKKDEPTDRFALTPKDFATFYQTFFDLWYDDYRKGKYMSVTLFDNLITMYGNHLPSQCGMIGKCHMQIVIEGNGNVYPCDFYVLDKYLCGNIVTDSLEDMIHSNCAKNFIQEVRTLSNVCTNCKYIHMCHGNCKRLSVCYYDENYCGYKAFLDYAEDRIYEIARYLKSNF